MKRNLFVLAVIVLAIVCLPGFAVLGRTAPHGENGQSLPPAPENNDMFKLLDGGQVLTVTARDYLIGAVACEMPPSYHTEALKAQAVAAYTYLSRVRNQQIETPDAALSGAHFQVDSKNRQGYMNKAQLQERWGSQFDAYYGRISSAVDAVLGYEMQSEGNPVLAAFHSISSGKTETAANVWGDGPEYLAPVDSPGDLLAPDYQTTVSLTADQMRERLTAKWESIILDEDPSQWFGENERSPSGTVMTMQTGDVTAKGTELRAALNLRSANFTMDCQNGGFTVTVLGYGHGVGMSQYGADYMARQGSKWQEILHWYYKDVEIVRTCMQ